MVVVIVVVVVVVDVGGLVGIGDLPKIYKLTTTDNPALLASAAAANDLKIKK